MSSKKIGLAIIGTGMAAKPHALALNELKDDINVVGVFSRNKEKRENFSKNYNYFPYISNSTFIFWINFFSV